MKLLLNFYTIISTILCNEMEVKFAYTYENNIKVREGLLIEETNYPILRFDLLHLKSKGLVIYIRQIEKYKKGNPLVNIDEENKPTREYMFDDKTKFKNFEEHIMKCSVPEENNKPIESLRISDIISSIERGIYKCVILKKKGHCYNEPLGFYKLNNVRIDSVYMDSQDPETINTLDNYCDYKIILQRDDTANHTLSAVILFNRFFVRKSKYSFQPMLFFLENGKTPNSLEIFPKLSDLNPSSILNGTVIKYGINFILNRSHSLSQNKAFHLLYSLSSFISKKYNDCTLFQKSQEDYLYIDKEFSDIYFSNEISEEITSDSPKNNTNRLFLYFVIIIASIILIIFLTFLVWLKIISNKCLKPKNTHHNLSIPIL